eukprot:CAMPEP_0185760634 /NCGR_PEP_ID=MMETSP1174-20130828/19548_1 /TAXON_ID=35687 /ORGANISM="Dictyocha speculum, Strain CCMP1381" /LENGTH=115 /DNA_ID=CAMNT_0028441539 /DNA_START=498 /DNA_END=845 /DNA_ORIENTATION=-
MSAATYSLDYRRRTESVGYVHIRAMIFHQLPGNSKAKGRCGDRQCVVEHAHAKNVLGVDTRATGKEQVQRLLVTFAVVNEIPLAILPFHISLTHEDEHKRREPHQAKPLLHQLLY